MKAFVPKKRLMVKKEILRMLASDELANVHGGEILITSWLCDTIGDDRTDTCGPPCED
jgi:hypothetical protein